MDLIGIATFLLAGLTPLTDPRDTKPDSGTPVIQSLHAEFAYVRPAPGHDASFITFLTDRRGNKAYKFECHAGGYYEPDYEIAFSGDFQCMLFPFKNDTVSAFNLLAVDTREETGNDWWNRGRMFAAQLQGDCQQFPEYSATRHFRLRGMALTLAFSGLEWTVDGKSLARFKLTLDAAPDPDATSPQALAPDAPEPPEACYPGPKPARVRHST